MVFFPILSHRLYDPCNNSHRGKASTETAISLACRGLQAEPLTKILQNAFMKGGNLHVASSP